MLSLKQLKDVCLCSSSTESDQCRYLRQDDVDYDKWYCVKLYKPIKDQVDKVISRYLNECAKDGIDPTHQATPLGDNCAGYPILKHVQQGYDI